MKAHELARRLLDGPDLPVVVVKAGELWEANYADGFTLEPGECWWPANGHDVRRDAVVEIS